MLITLPRATRLLALLSLSLALVGCPRSGGAPCGPATCSGCCTEAGACELGTAVSACGLLGNSCSSCGSQECVHGFCLPAPPCGHTLSSCGISCVDVLSDSAHCGGCDQACGEGEGCFSGECRCTSGRELCGAECIDLKRDENHCGDCATVCRAGDECRQGHCECPASAPLECGGTCIDPQSDAQHCGDCATACTAPESCAQGLCTCAAPAQLCSDGSCADLRTNPAHCGACGAACLPGQGCSAGVCTGCATGFVTCAGTCVDLQTDASHCGQCGQACASGYVCAGAACECAPGFAECAGTCIETLSDPLNCGACGVVCGAGYTCLGGLCTQLCTGTQQRCGTLCVDVQSHASHCGTCNHACPGGTCSGGGCVSCNSATTDCDGDGFLVSEGDCCDTPGACAAEPRSVNPGAVELMNTVDDNCNGMVDSMDPDLQACDAALTSNSSDPLDHASALGLCRRTQEVPPVGTPRTWGVISAQWLRADGSPLTSTDAVSIRPAFGGTFLAQQGQRLVVMSTGIAADATQSLPGPNAGPSSNQDHEHSPSDEVSLQTCTLPYCIRDWFSTPNPPLKAANGLPSAPGCGSFSEELAMDSVMLVLRIRAPTNAHGFFFKGLFLSDEYPEYVCTDYNDQLAVLVDTPGATPQVANPVDKNLMTYLRASQRWPVGINVAAGTDLFAYCDTEAANPNCWQSTVGAQSCQLGSGGLAGTGFEAPSLSECTWGGATRWLTTHGSVVPGGILELRFVIWDVGDRIYDSTALLDGFTWSATATVPGTD